MCATELVAKFMEQVICLAGPGVRLEGVRGGRWRSDPDYYGEGDTLELDAEYSYDVLGNRIQKAVTDGSGTTTTRYAYDLWNPAKAGAIGTSASDIWATLNGSSSLTSRQLQGDGIDQHFAYVSGSTAYWYLTDHLGSVRTVLDNSGAPAMGKRGHLRLFARHFSGRRPDGCFPGHAWT